MTHPIQSRSLYLKTPLLVAALALALGACDKSPEGANPDQVQSRIQSNLPALIDTTIESVGFLETNEAWNNLGASLGAFDSVTIGLPFGGDEFAEPVPAALGEDPDGQEIANMLIAEVFNESNYEGDGNYKIPGSLVCPDIEVFDEQNPDGWELVVDQECLDLITAIEPRIHVQASGDGLDFTLLIGPAKAEPLGLELRSDRISVAADLGEAKLAAEHIASVTGEDVDLPDVMQGIAAASLKVYGPQDVGIEFAIREDLNVEGALPGVGDLHFSSAAADPLVALRFDGLQQTFHASLDLHRTQLSMPWAAFDELSNATGTLAVDLQGLSASIELGNSANADDIVISNIGFGDAQSTVKLDEFTLFALDLNAESGRRFDLAMQPSQAQGLPTFLFAPEFSLELLADLSPLATAGDEVAGFLMGETYTAEVENSMQPVEGLDSAGLKAVAGAIRIGSTANNGNILVPEGQCLLPSELEAGEHEILGFLSAGPCPQ